MWLCACDEPADTATRLPATALLVTAEDDLGDTIRPRFEAMGGDGQRLLVIASSPDDERQSAIDWLRGKLADGPQPSYEMQAAADQNGFSLRTLKRAFREIQGVAFRDDFLREWHWRLPPPECQK